MAPTVESIYPSNESTGIPTGIDILIYFDSEIDQERAKQNIIITGPDFDVTSGYDSVQYVDIEKGRNPFFLQSPGYKGDLQGKFYFDLLNTDGTIFSGLDYHTGTPSYKTRVKFVPDKPLAALTEYTVYIIGDPDAADEIRRGISSRTVYSTQLGANLGSGNVVFRGGYKGTIDDQIVVTITSTGNIRTAEYEWYLASNPSIVYNGISSTKYRTLTDTGIELRFTGSDFQIGDTFTVNVYPPVYMESSYKYTFTTGSGNIEEIPDTTSTSVLGDLNSSTTLDEFEVLSTTPDHQETKISLNQRIIKVKFSADIDPTTITDKSVKVEAHPANGFDENVEDVGRLNKFLFVDGDTLYIILQTGES